MGETTQLSFLNDCHSSRTFDNRAQRPVIAPISKLSVRTHIMRIRWICRSSLRMLQLQIRWWTRNWLNSCDEGTGAA